MSSRNTPEPLPFPAALAGRVPVKVTNENGSIKPGDFLIPSKQFHGYAMKALVSGQVIGQALENFSSSATATSGTVLVFIKPGYQNVNNTFVLGENDGQISGSTGSPSPTSSSTSFLIDQTRQRQYSSVAGQ